MSENNYNYKIMCSICERCYWINGNSDEELDEQSGCWDDVCEHLAEGGKYQIVSSEPKEIEEVL